MVRHRPRHSSADSSLNGQCLSAGKERRQIPCALTDHRKRVARDRSIIPTTKCEGIMAVSALAYSRGRASPERHLLSRTRAKKTAARIRLWRQISRRTQVRRYSTAVMMLLGAYRLAL